MKFQPMDGPVDDAEGLRLALDLIDAVAAAMDADLKDPAQRKVAHKSAYRAIAALVAVLSVAERNGTPAGMLRFLRMAVKARRDAQR
ncbi:MAG TPA: hypothetical protein VGH74_07670 [Planctomycetaceae bacterium]|jgi:hypothetical protein